MEVDYIKNDRTIFVWLTGDGVKMTGSFNSEEDPGLFRVVNEALSNKDTKLIHQIVMSRFNLVEAINLFGRGKIAAVNGQLLHIGESGEPVALDTSLSRRIQSMIEAGSDVNSLTLLLENLIENPCNRAINDFYEFITANDLAITDDGHIIAYKIVTDDFYDLYTKKIYNGPGSIVKMDRSMVDDDPDQTCSHGLHICSRDYLPQYGGFYGSGQSTKIVAVKINPKHVVAFPRDYKNAKARVQEYEVIGEFAKTDPEFLKNAINKLESGACVNIELIKTIIGTIGEENERY